VDIILHSGAAGSLTLVDFAVEYDTFIKLASIKCSGIDDAAIESFIVVATSIYRVARVFGSTPENVFDFRRGVV
jgi:hypothetical protein